MVKQRKPRREMEMKFDMDGNVYWGIVEGGALNTLYCLTSQGRKMVWHESLHRWIDCPEEEWNR